MGAARFTVISPECIRIEWSPDGRFVDAPSLLAWYRSEEGRAARPAPAPAPGRIIDDSPASKRDRSFIDTPRCRLSYRPDGRPLGDSNLRAQIRMDGPTHSRHGASFSEWSPGMPNTGDLGGTLATLDGLREAAPLGPGLLSRDGWCLLDDSRGHLLIDGWVRAREWEGIHPDSRDWYLFAYGRDFRAGLRAFFDMAGPVPLPRRCLFGSWYSRYWPYTSNDFRAIVDDYDRHGLPLDVLVLDMDWHSAAARGLWTGWSWNRELLPDAESLLAWLHTRSLAVTLNLHPAQGVAAFEDRYEPFMRALGADPAIGHHEEFDAGNRPYMQSLFREVLGPFESPSNGTASSGPDAGVDFWWVDWQQDEFVRGVPGLTNLRWLNRLFFQHTASRPHEAGRRRGVSFSRWAGWGDHRHPIHFSGDAHTGWTMLEYQVPFTAAAGNAGCFFWSHDIGGHFGPRLEEATARWVQFGAMSAAVRLHSARSAALDRRPWTYEPRFQASMSAALSLRGRLMPFLYSTVRQCTRDGVPLLRPMYLDHAGQLIDESGDRAFRSPGQYLLGDDMLVAPITSAGVGPAHMATTSVWFPRSPDGSLCTWCDWFNGERFEGGSESIVGAAIDEFPLFVRAGVPIPMQPPTTRMTTSPLETLIIRLFPGTPGQVASRTLYEDDGESDAHARGGFRTTPILATWARDERADALCLRLEIQPAQGTFSGQADSRALVIEIAGAAECLACTIDGSTPASDPSAKTAAAPVELAADGHVPILRLALPPRPTLHGTTIELSFKPADTAQAADRARSRRFEAATGHALPAHALRRQTIIDGILSTTDEPLRQNLLAIGLGIAAVPDTTGPTASSAGTTDAFRIHDSLACLDDGLVRINIVDRVGTTEQAAQQLHLRWPQRERHPRPPTALPIPLPESALALPPLGLRAARLVKAEGSIGGLPLHFGGVAETRLRPLSAWLVAGPFPWDWRRSITAQTHGPEIGSGHMPFSLNDRFHATDGTPINWRSTNANSNGGKWQLDLRRVFHATGGLAYALTHIFSPHPQCSVLRLECGDKAEAWFNHTKVLTLDDWNPPSPPAPSRAPPEGTPLLLQRGWNTLMVKVTDGGGGWGFTATLEGEFELIESIDPAQTIERA